MGIFQLLQSASRKMLPREEKFFDLFEELCSKAMVAGNLLGETAKNNLPIIEAAKKLKQIEKEGDEISHRIINKARKTFVTPIDREDIIELSDKLDDIIDDIEKSLRHLKMYRVKKFPPNMIVIVRLICSQIKELEQALKTLRNLDQEKLLAHHEKIHDLENNGDDEKANNIFSLFKDKLDDDSITFGEMVAKELIVILERITDDCAHASNTVRGIIIKNC